MKRRARFSKCATTRGARAWGAGCGVTAWTNCRRLINVMRGEMSLVGPRPNLPEEAEQYAEWHKKRLTVSPGITGLWQVSGRSDLTFDEMVLLDLYYVENWDFALDVSILLRSHAGDLARARGVLSEISPP